jgi:hypothetical protein
MCAMFTQYKNTSSPKIVEPLALFMLFLNNKRELMQRFVAGASQHCVEEVCGVGVAVCTF